MVITIYNFIILFISYMIITFSTSNMVSVWYCILCLSGIMFTALFKHVLYRYPLVSYNHRDAIKAFCYREFNIRLMNNLFSGIIHIIMLSTLINKVSLSIAIFCTIMFKIIILVQGKMKVQEEINE